ncbi:two-component sensor histidine kinase [Gloeomargarita lithophora Alchichica-D10]|uniref:histidine kinase n=1 Tax=Gloeomargarita lithophora Alchichica-D10 TaxID=1188229 RepID=A0A1J0AFA9_9CYAN|nr:HAMP domain-containing sensor histidine kinase [Gloeomargarita lithophora]APB34587.1 two-component sensor histidine kinase [Gloeomargarita lithophora Alchichica-D10]
MITPPLSPEFINLCQGQVELLGNIFQVSRCTIYLRQPAENWSFTPVATYPQTQPALPGSSWLTNAKPEQLVLPLVQGEVLLGLLVLLRPGMLWSGWEQEQLQRATQTLVLAWGLEQQRQNWQTRTQSLTDGHTQTQELLATVLHQLRSPLSALKTFAQLLRKRLGGAKDQEVVTGMLAQTERIAELLLRLEPTAPQPRLPGGSVPLLLPGLTLEPVRVAEVLTPLVMTAHLTAQERGLTLGYTPVSPTLAAQADAQALREVVSNLLDNSLKYTPPGGHVEVGAEATPAGVVIWVQDDGLGIPGEEQLRVFERHYRGCRTATTPGDGLGLAVVQELVSQMGGRITLTSPPGTRMEIWLPNAGQS